ncbi:hypothetical protein DY000_02053171 [Brassica cretica]|uniref:Uncharacterized protein n=1 Tax=Brassica cretica TaxID=69181 RepID=A0ABQ7AKI4_BRACR|nr:hypothetical protein DY000_02053171 [Brassica cretica]
MGTASPPDSPGLLGGNRENQEEKGSASATRKDTVRASQVTPIAKKDEDLSDAKEVTGGSVKEKAWSLVSPDKMKKRRVKQRFMIRMERRKRVMRKILGRILERGI